MIDRLTEICRKHVLDSPDIAVVAEPYVPFLPNDWNRILVLAEAQNLSNSSTEYVGQLKSANVDERIRRLVAADPLDIGVQPWDDGSLKLAIASALEGIRVECTAVSNAVLWSQVSTEGNNANPDAELAERSIGLWSEMLPILNPKHIITAGKVAHGVISRATTDSTPAWQHTSLRSPSPTAMSRVSGMFQETDLLRRYPEVAQAVERHPEWVEKSYRQNKLFFACHAVSLMKA